MRRKNLDAVPYYHALREAFDQPGCPICRLLAGAADRQLEAVLWEMVNDPKLRGELNEARGYCSPHTWLLVRDGAALGISILSKGLITTLLRVLEDHPLAGQTGLSWQSLKRSLDRQPGKAEEKLMADLEPQRPCPVCEQQAGLERDLLRTLAEHLAEPGALAAVYAGSEGLCLAHFRRAVAQTASPAEAGQLVEAQRQVWQGLAAELAEFIRKNDHRFRDEAFGPERDAWRRALGSLAGPAPRERSGRQGLMNRPVLVYNGARTESQEV